MQMLPVHNINAHGAKTTVTLIGWYCPVCYGWRKATGRERSFAIDSTPAMLCQHQPTKPEATTHAIT